MLDHSSVTEPVRQPPMARFDRLRPLLIGKSEARHQLGGIGTTALYVFLRRHNIPTVPIGGRSMWRLADIEEAVDKLAAEAAAAIEERGSDARALAKASVTARRQRRGATT